MSTANSYLTIRGINVDVVYKDIKNLHIGVYPPLGRIRVAAPTRLDEEKIRLAVIQRLPWIKRQRERLRGATRQSQREMVTGESHYVWGIRHRLKVIERDGRPKIEVQGNRLVLNVPPGVDAEARRQLLENWQRRELRARIPVLIAQWEPAIGRTVTQWQIRRMKTKWGSCNPEAGRVWFNLELAKKHPLCLEYIVVHEMVHFLERSHGERFTKLMDGFLPDWRSRRDELNGAPLAHEEWTSDGDLRTGAAA
ncbi:MAG: SprT family zinc-dependent metalloprotease [Solirubrobacteraceae bacterium]|jgi:predicted metal-dependent hydrolase